MRVGFDLEHHLAHWTVTDRVSGNSGSVDDYTMVGIGIGVGYTF